MPNYEPMSRETHLARGHCCDMGCVYCPWRQPKLHDPMVVNPWIAIALNWSINVVIHSGRQSLVLELVLADRVKIIYREYEKCQSNIVQYLTYKRR